MIDLPPLLPLRVTESAHFRMLDVENEGRKMAALYLDPSVVAVKAGTPITAREFYVDPENKT